jgi:capsular exopolysaccharide synthesis family protein
MSKFVTAWERAEQENRLESRRSEPERSTSSADMTAAADITPPQRARVVGTLDEPMRSSTANNGHDAARTFTVPPDPARPEPRTRTLPDRLNEHLVSLLAPTSFEAEQYRVLRHRVEQFRKSDGVSVFAVSSPTVGDGKTTTAINLAGALSQAPDGRVLIMDCDLRRPSVASEMALDNHENRGLVDAILNEQLTLDDVVQVLAPLNLSILPAGKRPAAPYEVLQSPRLEDLLTQARSRYDYIIVDTPPLVSVPDCRVIGKWVDGFLIVVAAHRTSRKLVEEAMQIPEPGKILGLVFNGDDHHFSMDYYAHPARTNGAIWQPPTF